MSRHDDYDDAEWRPRRRRRPAYDEDFDTPPPWHPRRSGAVTAVGVVNIILGSFALLGGLGLLLGGLVLTGFLWQHQQNVAQQGGQMPNVSGVVGALTVVATILALLLGAVFFVTGVGITRRRPWARIVSFILAGLFTVAGVFFLVTITLLLVRPAPAEGWLFGLLLNLLAAGLCFGYAVFVFMTLLKAGNAREFE